MSGVAPAPAPAPSFKQEKTFSTYNSDQSKHYANVRLDYHPSLYQAVIDHHTSTGGQLDTLLDVGCGPGLATRNLALNFSHAIGIDPSEGMLETARSLGGNSSTNEPIRYEQSNSEQLGANLENPIKDNSVDLITAANAAHWFNMSDFWSAAARVLKPGGSVAIWGSGEIRAHPDTPNYEKIQAMFEKHQEEDLSPYYNEGNLMTRSRYTTLPLPWTLEQPVAEFDKSTFYRKDWQVGEPFFTGEQTFPVAMMEKLLSTGSPVTRWREANPDLVGTDRDILIKLRKEVERLLGEVGVEKDKMVLKGTVLGVLLVVKKQA